MAMTVRTHEPYTSGWKSPSQDDAWNSPGKRPRIPMNKPEGSSSRPVMAYQQARTTTGNKPELPRRMAPYHDSSASFRTPPEEDFYSPPPLPPPRYSTTSSTGHHSGSTNGSMCNPRPPARVPPVSRRPEPDRIPYNQGGRIGADHRSRSPPRGYKSSRSYTVDTSSTTTKRGYGEYAADSDQSWQDRSYKGGPRPSAEGSYASFAHQDPPTRHYPPPPPRDRLVDRETVIQREFQRDSSRPWNYNSREYPERHGREFEGRFCGGNNDRSLVADRGGRGDNRGYSQERFTGSAIVSNTVSRNNVRGYPLANGPNRRPEDVEHSNHGPPRWEPARDAPRNNTVNNAVVERYHQVSRAVQPAGTPPQRWSTTGFGAEDASVIRKRGIDPQEQSPPKKRLCPTDETMIIAPAMSTPSKLAETGRWEPSSTRIKLSTLPNVAASVPASISRSVTSTVPTSISPRITTTPENQQCLSTTNTTDPQGTTTTAKPFTSKVIDSAPPAVAVKEKTSTGIPMRWLKPANKPKAKVATTKEAPKPQEASIPKSSDTVSAMVIPRQMKKEDASLPASPSTSHRMVTDSEGGSTASNSRELLALVEHSKATPQVPVAIVTTNGTDTRNNLSVSKRVPSATRSIVPRGLEDEEYDDEPPIESSSSSEDDTDDSSDTDDDEVRNWASVMFGLSGTEKAGEEKNHGSDNVSSQEKAPLKLRLKLSSSKIAILKAERKKLKMAQKAEREPHVSDGDPPQSRIKLKERGRTKKNRKSYLEAVPEATLEEREMDEELQRIERQEELRIREEAKPLTPAQIREILGEDDLGGSSSCNWVRRSVRQPSRALLNSKPLKALVAGLKNDDADLVVLKMKKYINDPDAPSCVIDAALDALEENSNCEALYIQNFNEGMRDRQVLHLLKILQSPRCRIWCLNIGENYNVEMETWDKFTKGLRKTKITHMYASEHTITTEMKDEIRETIRENRKKHDLHINPNNLDVIVQCTHCWWNPINAKVLVPYLRKKGYEHILNDTEGQGLRGSMSEVPSL